MKMIHLALELIIVRVHNTTVCMISTNLMLLTFYRSIV